MRDRLSSNRALVAWLVGLTIALVGPSLLSEFQVFQLALILIYAIAILGLNLLTGYAGQISLGQAALFGIGAYVAAITMRQLAVPYPLTVPLAAAFCFVVGLALGAPALRLRGMYLGLVTLGFALVFAPILIRMTALTGGVNGYSVPAVDVPEGLPLSINRWMYLVTLAVAFIGFVGMRRLVRGRLGRAFLAQKQSEPMAAAMGINVNRNKIIAFAISSAYAGAAGAVFAFVVGAVQPDAFTFSLSANLLVAAVLGGTQSTIGALFGAAIIVLVPSYTATFSKGIPQFAFAAAILAVIYLQPEGLVAALGDVAGRLRRSRGTQSHQEPEAVVGHKIA